MATYFGEVIFSHSRACHSDAYEEDDEEEENAEFQLESFEIEMIPLMEKKFTSSALIVSFGVLANDFMQGCIRNDNFQLIGKIEMRKVNEKERMDTGDFHSKVFKSSPLFLSEKGVLICLTAEDVTPDLSWKYAKQVLSLIGESSPILILSSHHISKLNCEVDENQRCLSYCIHSSNFSSSVPFPALPQPTVLESIPAAIMTASLLENRACMICASYVESFSSGNVDLVEGNFTKVISALPFSSLVHYEGSKNKCKNNSDLLDRYM